MDSGYTMRYLKNLLLSRKPASLEICVLLEKPSRLKVRGSPSSPCCGLSNGNCPLESRHQGRLAQRDDVVLIRRARLLVQVAPEELGIKYTGFEIPDKWVVGYGTAAATPPQRHPHSRYSHCLGVHAVIRHGLRRALQVPALHRRPQEVRLRLHLRRRGRGHQLAVDAMIQFHTPPT